MTKRILALALALLLCCAPLSALAAEESAVPVIEDVPVEAAEPVPSAPIVASIETAQAEPTVPAAELQTTDSGTCGANLTWSFDTDTGALTISGTGAMDDYKDVYSSSFNRFISSAPWGVYFQSIQSVSVAGGVTSIGKCAFEFCDNLTSVSISDSVTSIGSYAFFECDGLTGVAVPAGVTSLAGNAFRNCRSLTDITVSEDNPAYASLNGVLFNKSMTQLICFPGGKGGEYTVPDSVTEIFSYAFRECSGLTGVTIPDGVTKIKEYTFEICSGLASVSIGSGVAAISENAFSDCSSLDSIHVSPSNAVYASQDGVLLNKELTELIRVPVKRSGVYAIPGSVTRVEKNAFEGCADLTGVTIPDSVTSIGRYAFFGCSGLTDVTIPDGITVITDYMFCNCSSLTSITVPDSVTAIETYAFNGCRGLTSVSVGSGVASVGVGAFNGCSALTNVTASADNETYTSQNGVLFNKTKTELVLYPGGKSGAYTIPDSVGTVAAYAFNGCANLTDVLIPDSVVTVGNNAFNGCSGLKSVVYFGSEEQWNSISIGSNNAQLKKAARAYHTDHIWTIQSVDTPATCTGAGLGTYVCVCGETKQDTIPATGHDPIHHDAVAATESTDGNIEYWECAACGKLFTDAACTTEVTAAETLLPRFGCAHPSIEAHESVAADYTKDGCIAYWYCPACERCFSDSGCTAEITAAETVIPQLVDAGGKTDAELVALGAVAKTVSPDGAAKGFADLAAAFTEAKTWTETGGSLLLLTDVTIEDSVSAAAGGYLSAQSADYDNTEVAGMPTKGFWIDLGGHTIDARLAKAFVYTATTGYINLRNGTILFTDNGRTTGEGGAAAIYGVITLGISSTSPISGSGIRKITINFDRLNLYVASSYVKSEPAVISGSLVNTTVNVRESNLINNTNQPALKLYRTKSTASNAALAANGANYVVNISGGSTVGTLSSVKNAIHIANYSNSVAFTAGVNYTLTVNADSDTMFLGAAAVGGTAGALAEGGYTVTTNTGDYLETARSFTHPIAAPDAVVAKAWVHPTTYVAEDLSAQTAAAPDAGATLTYGANIAYFAEINDAFAAAEKIGATTLPTTVTLNAAPTTAYALGAQGCTCSFTLDQNGQMIPETGLFEIAATQGKTVTVTMASAAAAKLFEHLPELTFNAGDAIVLEKGSLLMNYSLNLEENVSINLYTDGANGDPDAVSYVQDGKAHTIAAKDSAGAWVIDTLAAKQMSETVDVYAVKKNGTTIYADAAKGISVKGYVEQDPASVETGEVALTLAATLDTMMIYGKYAEKYFGSDFTEISSEELTAIGVSAVPATDTTNLTDAARVVDGMDDHMANTSATSGYWGSAAVLEDSISLKFYFYGSEFDGATATVGGEAAAVEDNGDGFKYVKAAVSAKDFDTAITVALTASDGVTALGSVTDSVSGYTSRIASTDDAYHLAQALRAYGADAKRFAEAKAGA